MSGHLTWYGQQVALIGSYDATSSPKSPLSGITALTTNAGGLLFAARTLRLMSGWSTDSPTADGSKIIEVTGTGYRPLCVYGVSRNTVKFVSNTKADYHTKTIIIKDYGDPGPPVVQPSYTFEFRTSGAASGSNIKVDISAASNATDVATAFMQAVIARSSATHPHFFALLQNGNPWVDVYSDGDGAALITFGGNYSTSILNLAYSTTSSPTPLQGTQYGNFGGQYAVAGPIAFGLSSVGGALRLSFSSADANVPTPLPGATNGYAWPPATVADWSPISGWYLADKNGQALAWWDYFNIGGAPASITISQADTFVYFDSRGLHLQMI